MISSSVIIVSSLPLLLYHSSRAAGLAFDLFLTFSYDPENSESTGTTFNLAAVEVGPQVSFGRPGFGKFSSA